MTDKQLLTGDASEQLLIPWGVPGRPVTILKRTGWRIRHAPHGRPPPPMQPA